MFEISFPSEKVIEDYVYDYITSNSCCPISGDGVDLCLRQHEIKGYGVTDLIKISITDGFLHVTILELKNEPLKESHVSQLCRYMAGASRQLKRYRKRFNVCLHGELAGPFNLNTNDVCYLLDSVPSISAFSLELTMESGFDANEIGSGWHHRNENKLGAKPIARDMFDKGYFHNLGSVKATKRRSLGFA